MLIRRLVLAVLIAGAGVAQAEVVSSNQPGFLSGWTTGNGTDVLGSGVLAGNLIGGISYTTNSAANVSLSDVLYGKASANLSQANGQTTLFFQRGIEGTYLLGAGNGMLAARLGDGKSVVASADGAVISEGKTGGGAVGGGGYSGTAPGHTGNLPGVGNGAETLPGNGTGLTPNPGNSQVTLPTVDADPTAIPEPATLGLMLAGLLGAGSLQRRRKQ